LRDGTRYRFDSGRPSWVRDRNGNVTTFSYSGQTVTVTDSLGRRAIINPPTQAQNYSLVSFTGVGGAARPIRIDYAPLGNSLRTTQPSDSSALQSDSTLFPQLGPWTAANNETGNPTVVSSVTLPDGRQYRFYYNVYNEPARVVLPTGGAIEYDYAAGLSNGYAGGAINLGAAFGGGYDRHIYRRVAERRVYRDGATLEGKTVYDRPETIDSSSVVQTLGYVTVEQRDAANALLASRRHYFNGRGAAATFKSGLPTYEAFSYPRWKEGRESQTNEYTSTGRCCARLL
jgi:hypothetical protein